jgi:hypothetical protein
VRRGDIGTRRRLISSRKRSGIPRAAPLSAASLPQPAIGHGRVPSTPSARLQPRAGSSGRACVMLQANDKLEGKAEGVCRNRVWAVAEEELRAVRLGTQIWVRAGDHGCDGEDRAEEKQGGGGVRVRRRRGGKVQ